MMTENTQPEHCPLDYTQTIFPGERRGYPGVGQSFGVLLILLGIAVGVQLVLFIAIFYLPGDIKASETFYLAQSFLAYGLGFLVTALVLVSIKNKKEGTRYRWFRRGSASGADLVILALLTVFLGTATEPVYKFIPSPEWMDKLIRQELSRLIQPHILSFATIAILPAILEETVFRGIILDGLLRRISPVKAILLSSFLFGLIHLNPMQFVGGIIAGIFMGWVYWRTKSLVACMLIHGINNGISFLLALRYGLDATTETLVGNMYIPLVVACAVLFILGCWWLRRRWSVHQHSKDAGY